MAAWLKGRAEARRDAEAMTDALEAELRARPSAEAYDALRARAGRRWAEVEPRVLAWLEERNHALVYEVLLRQGRLDEALRLLRAAAARPTARGATHLNLACALERAGRLEEARTTLTRAAQLLPNDPVVPLAAAVLALRRHDVDVADRALRDAAACGRPAPVRRRGSTTPAGRGSPGENSIVPSPY
jgi:tetratricopeptide (TPR) repeat protein